MLATMEIVDLLDSSETIGHMVMNSDTMHHYNEAKFALENDREAQALIKRFADIKEHYEDVQRFGRYHPDYHDIMKKVRSVKREMDMHETVAHFKKAEREVQKLLDEISENVAFSVSEQIKVPKNGMALTDSGCSGGCGSGGSCGCS
ncbi:YlbF family regulator [Halobacillus halophilus]|uniref:YlbF family regulator n=1 Tax=Halobacillus halophilus TaxID=1570 RepID=UPI001CD7B1B1|nr:YlbF family regulator [Halobacillus halophilus]MCA1012536.1 YlbF family regulator [Halobacillus halophilus]